MGVPPSRLRGRQRSTTYLYDDRDHPERITGTVETPDWTPHDRAALLALESYEQTLCPGCGHPKHIAWQINGWHRAKHYVCDACSAQTGEGDQRQDVTYSVTYLEDGFDPTDLPPLQ